MRLSRLMLVISALIAANLFVARPVFCANDADARKKLDMVLNQMEKRNKSLKSLSADIESVRVIKLLDVKEKSSGKVYFKKPNLLRLELEKPRKKLTVCDGKTVWMYEPSLEQVQKIPMRSELKDKRLSAFSFGLIRDVRELDKDYVLTFLREESYPAKKNTRGKVIEKSKKVYVIQMVPKDENGKPVETGKKMIFHIVDGLWVPEEIDEYESDGEIVTSTYLRKIKVNPWMWGTKFSFKVPRGVDVVEPFGN